MKRLFLLLALVGMIATSCEDSGIEEPSNPTEQPDDNTDEEQPGDDDNTDEEQPGGDDNTDEEQPGGDDNTDEEQSGGDENNDDDESPVFEIDGPGKYTIGAEGGSIDVVVTTNLEYRLEVSEDAQSWLTIADTRAVRTERLTISVSPNNTDSERTATISVFDGADNKVFSFTLTQEYANPDEIIKFVDNTTKTICLINWDTNGDAELSIGEAVAVTDIGRIFQSKDIMSFDEFKYFTGVTTIVNGAFKDCEILVKISIPDSVTAIGDEAFRSCFSLTSVTIPDSVTTIGSEAFRSCSSLTSVTIGDGVTTIGSEAFSGCGSLTEFKGSGASSDGLCIINNKGVLLYFLGNALAEYIIPDSVTAIGEKAFFGCSSLTCVTIPDSVISIGDEAFYDCRSLTSVTIPDSVIWIGDSAFYECESLTSITIPDSVTSISSSTFYGCDSLTSVTIGDSVTTIGSQAFDGCDSLTSVTIPDGVTTIRSEAFEYCRSLTSVTIPDSVTEIEGYAFAYCSSLTSVTIGDGVTKIGGGAFAYCSSLTSVYCKALTPPSLGYNAFKYWDGLDHVPYGCDIYVPTGSISAYQSAEGWSDYADAIVGYDF